MGFLCPRKTWITDWLTYRTHNDWAPAGRYAHGHGAVDLYTWDGYPQAFNCRDPTTWREVDSTFLDVAHKVCLSALSLMRGFIMLQSFYPDVMWATAEFQAGAFDPWGGVGGVETLSTGRLDVMFLSLDTTNAIS